MEFYNERRGILARYDIEAPLPAAAARLGLKAVLAEYPSPPRKGRLSLFERAQRIGGNMPSMAQREYSEETARRIDEEIRNLFEAAHERVRQTLTAQREVLTSLAKLLMQKEVVSRDDLVGLPASAEV